MRGLSYMGWDQWVTAAQFPPHLKTIVPAASGFPGPYLEPSTVRWISLVSGTTRNQELFADSAFWIQKYRDLYLDHLPFKSLDTIAGVPTPYFHRWLEHPALDAYWEAMNPRVEEYRRIDLPILSITGYYDSAQTGAMRHYRMHMKYGSSEARAKHYLLIGPWQHHGTDEPVQEFAGWKFGKAILLDIHDLERQWFDWTLKDGEKPKFLRKPVTYYLAGAEEWKYADSLEKISNTKMTLYLSSSNGGANDLFHSGTLSTEAPGPELPDKYIYDPLDTRSAGLEHEGEPQAIKGQINFEIPKFITNQTYALNLFGNGLIYQSEPFSNETEITGYLRLVTWIALEVPDTDFEAIVSEILPDGTSIRLTQDWMRARYRESPRDAKLVKSGDINQYEFANFKFFSRLIAKGSRLRLVLRSPNSIFQEKNYNSGGIVADESGKDARTAHVTLYHDSQHLSYLELPLVR
jgi:putative CocE/NonD family hydrolase